MTCVQRQQNQIDLYSRSVSRKVGKNKKKSDKMITFRVIHVKQPSNIHKGTKIYLEIVFLKDKSRFNLEQKIK
jgi:hypothetical protein